MNEKSQPAPLESAMDTGTDDEPALTIGDKHTADALDPNGDGILSVAEAETLLGDTSEIDASPQTEKPTISIEGK